MASATKVLLLDDHPIALQSLEKKAEVEIVGRAHCQDSLDDELNRLQPDLVLVDLRTPGSHGLSAVRRIKEEHPETAVIVLTLTESKQALLEAVLAGAAGYITQDTSPAILSDVIRAVRSGISMMPTDLLRESMAELVRPTPPTTVQEPPRGPLTEREHQVLHLLAQGYSNKAISEALSIVEATVKKHVHNIIRKLAVTDRTQAAVASLKMGLVSF